MPRRSLSRRPSRSAATIARPVPLLLHWLAPVRPATAPVKQSFDRAVVNGELTLVEGANTAAGTSNVRYPDARFKYSALLKKPFSTNFGATNTRRKALHGPVGKRRLCHSTTCGDIVKRSHLSSDLPNLSGATGETEPIRSARSCQPAPSSRPDKHGGRLRCEARHVKVGDRTLPATSIPDAGRAKLCEYAAY